MLFPTNLNTSLHTCACGIWKEISSNSYPGSSISKAFCTLAPFRIFFVLVSVIHFRKFSAIITSIGSLFCFCYFNFVHFSYLEIFSQFFLILFFYYYPFFFSITINLSSNLLILSSATPYLLKSPSKVFFIFLTVFFISSIFHISASNTHLFLHAIVPLTYSSLLF